MFLNQQMHRSHRSCFVYSSKAAIVVNNSDHSYSGNENVSFIIITDGKLVLTAVKALNNTEKKKTIPIIRQQSFV